MRYKARTLTTSDGQTDTVANWAAKTGIKKTTIMERINRGWSPDDALKPVDANYLTANGERLSIAEWSRRTGIGEDAIRRRVKRGWSDEAALEMAPPPPTVPSRAEIARRLGISPEALRQRLLNGWNPDDAFSLGNVHGTIVKPNAKKRGRKRKNTT